MANRPTQLNIFLIVSLVVLLSLSFISGIGLWYIHEQGESPGGNVPQWTKSCRILHGLLNPAICAVFGFLWASHIRGGWKMRINRKSGGSLTALLILLIGSGVGLYYADEAGHFWFTVHLIPGLLIAFVLPAHWLAARKWVRAVEDTSTAKLDDQGSKIRTTQ